MISPHDKWDNLPGNLSHTGGTSYRVSCPIAEASSVVVRVPATSANVGVGFDCLGLALSMEATFALAPSPDGALHVSGCDLRFQGEDNLVWTSYCHTSEVLGIAPHPLAITIDSPIPLSGGLGSSSACIVAGVAAAFALGGLPYDREQALQIASSLEGHPDNVAPAILGGLVCCLTQLGVVEPIHYHVADDLRFVAIIPPYEVRTALARRMLPQEVPLHDVVWQTSRCVAMTRALETGDAHLLALAAHDHVHEPHRATLIPDYQALRSAALQAGASCFLISGSGATTLAVCKGDRVAGAVHRVISTMESVAAAEGQHRGLQVEVLRANTTGATVELA